MFLYGIEYYLIERTTSTTTLWYDLKCEYLELMKTLYRTGYKGKRPYIKVYVLLLFLLFHTLQYLNNLEEAYEKNGNIKKSDHAILAKQTRIKTVVRIDRNEENQIIRGFLVTNCKTVNKCKKVYCTNISEKEKKIKCVETQSCVNNTCMQRV